MFQNNLTPPPSRPLKVLHKLEVFKVIYILKIIELMKEYINIWLQYGYTP